MVTPKTPAMHVVRVVSRQGGREYTSTLLRNSYREDGKVKKQTLANLSHLPEPLIELICPGSPASASCAAGEALSIRRSLPHGHVAAVLGMTRSLGLPGTPRPSTVAQPDLAVALVAARLIAPASKLATAALLGQSTLGAACGVEGADENELYGAMDWLLARQARVERSLAARHLAQAPSCCTTCRRCTSRAATAPSRAMATPATTAPTGRRSSSACSPMRGAARSRRGLPGQHRRPRDPRGPVEKLRALRPHRHRPRGRPGDAHQRPDRAPPRGRRDRLGELPARSCHPGLVDAATCSWACSTSATSRDHEPRVPGRAPRRVPQPALAAERARKREALLSRPRTPSARSPRAWTGRLGPPPRSACARGGW